MKPMHREMREASKKHDEAEAEKKAKKSSKEKGHGPSGDETSVLETSSEFKQLESEISALTQFQSKRRQRRASIDLNEEQLSDLQNQTADEEAATPKTAAVGNWTKVNTNIKMAYALGGLAKDAADERTFLESLEKTKNIRTNSFAMRQRIEAKSRSGVLHPASTFRRFWDGMIMGLLCYMAIAVPFRIGFDVQPMQAWFVFEVMIDIIFMLDLALNFRTGYMMDEEDEDSSVEMDWKRIGKRYLRGWFWIDIVSAVPTTILLGESDSGSANKLPRLLKIPRLVRMLRLVKLVRLMRLMKSQNMSMMDKLLAHTGLPPPVLRALRLMILTVMLSHVLGCGWHFMHLMRMDHQKSWWMVYCDGVEFCRGGASVAYIISVYWAVTTLTTMGYGDITPATPAEFIYTIVVMLIGVSFYAYIASNVSIVLSNLNESGAEFKNNMDKLREFMMRKRLSFPLRRRLRKYFSVHWKRKVRVTPPPRSSGLPVFCVTCAAILLPVRWEEARCAHTSWVGCKR